MTDERPGWFRQHGLEIGIVVGIIVVALWGLLTWVVRPARDAADRAADT